MKKLFIGLLIIAAGVGVYYLIVNKKKPGAGSIDTEQLAGRWKVDPSYITKDTSGYSLSSIMDSLFLVYTYEFKKDGKMYLFSGSTLQDSSLYAWTPDLRLAVKESTRDIGGDTLKVRTLNKDSLIIYTKDTTQLLFTRAK